MSRKLFEKVKQAGTYIKKPFTSNTWSQPSNNSSSNFQREPKWKRLNQSIPSLNQNFESLKKYAKETYNKNWKQTKDNQKQPKKNQTAKNQKRVNLSDFFQKGFEKVINQKQTKEILSKQLEKVQQNASLLSSGVGQKLGQLGKTIANQKEKISQIGGQASKKLSEQAQKVKKQGVDKINAVAESKLQLFSKLLNRMFWKIALLIGLGLFAYGVGTSLPREIRLFLSKKKQKELQSTGDKQNQNGPNNDSK